MPTLSLQPDGTVGVDAYLISNTPNSNTGTSTDLLTGTLFLGGNSIYYRSLLRFDLSSIPSGVSAATLTLTKAGSVLDSPPQTFACYRLTQTAWTETGVTWNRYDGTNTWTSAGGDYTTALGHELVISSTAAMLAFSIPQLCADAVANRNGLLNVIVTGPQTEGVSNYCNCASSDHATSSLRPLLEVTYAVHTDAEAEWICEKRDRADWTIDAARHG